MTSDPEVTAQPTDRRQRILQVASELFATRGYDGTSMRDVSEACAISKSLLYHYYPGKEALIFAIITTHLEELDAAIEHLTALTDHAPEFAEGWHTRATAYFGIGLLGPALEDLEHALALNPNNYNAIFGLGTIFETLGDERRAFEAYTRAASIHPFQDNIAEALERLRPSVQGKTL